MDRFVKKNSFTAIIYSSAEFLIIKYRVLCFIYTTIGPITTIRKFSLTISESKDPI